MNNVAEQNIILTHNDFFDILRNVEYKRLDNNK